MNQSDTPLSHRLRNETKDAHTTAERSGIMRDVLRGTVSLEAYVALLANLRALYHALETQLDVHQDHAALAGVNWNALKRTAALDADITSLAGSRRDAIVLERSTNEYVRHLEQLGAGSPALLFPHAYLRYLGDLYGGQIMKRILLQTFPDFGSRAFSFYTFNELPHPEAFKAGFRQAIDALPLGAGEADLVVAEAQRGYDFHAAIFTELAADQASWRGPLPPAHVS